MEYEICFLVGEAKESDLDKIKSEVEKVVKKHQGVFTKDEWEKKRRLAYEIKKEARGTYVAKRFTLPNKDERDEKFPGVDFIGDITNDLNFNQNILRFIIVKADELLSLDELKEKDVENDAKEQKTVLKKNESDDVKNKSVKKDGGDKEQTVIKSEKTEKDDGKKNENDGAVASGDSEKGKETEKEVEEKDVKKKEMRSEELKKKDKKQETKSEKKESQKTSKDDSVSEDDMIDEKLDEILNI